MLTELTIEDFGCVRRATLRPTALHALIGPNDSGKSTLLRAVHELLEPIEKTGNLVGQVGDLRVTCNKNGRRGVRSGEKVPADSLVLPKPFPLRIVPEHAQRASKLLTGDARVTPTGERLAGVYDVILNRDREAFDAIEQRTCELFPAVRRLGLSVVGDSLKELHVDLVGGQRVTAARFSEGLLYWLVFATLPSTVSDAIVLLDEPETGLHPARVADLVKVLRHVSERTQVLIATHSPLLVNELRPEEVSVVTRTNEAGTVVRRFSDVPDVTRMLETFSLGELWLAYANGIDEHDLFAPGSRP